MNYPDLSDSKVIAFDVETYDPQLKELGPGVYRKDGNVLGMAIANEQGFAEYYNLGHPNTDRALKEKNLKYITDVMAINTKKLGTFILYDLDWTENSLGIKVNGELHDIQVAEPLINENQHSYSLESLAKKYTGKEKRIDTLQEFCDRNNLKGDPRQHIYLMDYERVRNYAIGDVKLPIEIFKKQWSILNNQELLQLYHMEMELFPLLLQMRKNGVRIDEIKLQEGIKTLRQFIKDKSGILFTEYGSFNYNSSQQIAKVFDSLNVQYPRTEKGNPNLEKAILKYEIDHPISDQILELKEASKILNTFFINSLTGHNVNGRIHCLFYPNKTEEYGAKSGRFSSADPNLQQIPSREETYGQLCRSIFIPEEGKFWGKIDWNQIEYRLIAHYAIGPKSEHIRKQYNEDPNTDYHQMIMELTGLNRKRAKILNFGIAYLMGSYTMHREFGWPVEECQQLIDLYNREVPFVKETRNWVMQVARSRGFIRTILRRRARVTPEMIQAHKEYSMFNRLIQGSAADLMKKAMRDSYKAGIFEVLDPHLTVHDELDFSIDPTKEEIEACRELKNIMENCVKLKVPIIADLEVGSNWGTVHKFDFTLKGFKSPQKELKI